MRLSDDYPGEMDRLSSDEAQVVERVRGALLQAPEPEVAASHLASMAAAAAQAELGERRNPMRAFTRRRGVVLAAAAALALGAGLAAAVTLPDQASDRAEQAQAEKAAGTNGQDGPSVASSAHGQAVSDLARDDSTRGCEHGRAVSDLASSKADDNRNNDGPADDPCDKDGNGGANRATGKAWGHGDPPGKKLGHAKQGGVKGGGSASTSSGGAGSQGAGHRSDGSTAGADGKGKSSAGVESDSDGTTSEPSPAPEPSPTPTPEPSPTA